ncbi:hypothetical protein Tco_1061055, partial [Tanacetum coccineum]
SLFRITAFFRSWHGGVIGLAISLPLNLVDALDLVEGNVKEDDRARFEGVSMADNDGDGCLTDWRITMKMAIED